MNAGPVSSIWSILPLSALLVAVYLYGRGVIRSGGAGPLTTPRVGLFGVGIVLMALALSPWVEGPASRSLFAHMVQHQLLLIAPLPLLLGRVGTGMLLGFDRSLRGRVAIALRRVWPVMETLTRPAVAWASLVVIVAVWHLPALFDAALRSEILHGLEHLSFAGAALVYWSSLIGLGRASQARYLHMLASVFGLALFGTALGALLTFATSPWFPDHAARASAAGLDWLTDQQLAGVTMWLPGGLLLLGTFLVVGRRWLESLETGASPD